MLRNDNNNNLSGLQCLLCHVMLPSCFQDRRITRVFERGRKDERHSKAERRKDCTPYKQLRVERQAEQGTRNQVRQLVTQFLLLELSKVIGSIQCLLSHLQLICMQP